MRRSGRLGTRVGTIGAALVAAVGLAVVVSGSAAAAEVSATLVLEVDALGGDTTTPPFDPASFHITAPNQAGFTEVATGDMSAEGGTSPCEGVSETLCSESVALTVVDGVNSFKVSVENGPAGRLPVFSGDCRGIQVTAQVEAVVDLSPSAPKTCRVTFVQADATGSDADAVVVVEKTFDLGAAPAAPFLLDVVRVDPLGTLVDADVRDMRRTSPAGAGDCVPLPGDQVECEWIAAFAAPLTAPGTVLLEETVPGGWFPVYGGDCDRRGTLPAATRHELVRCSIENVALETGAVEPDRVLTVELVGSAATGDSIQVEVLDGPSAGAASLAQIDSDELLDANGSLCDPLPAASVCRGDIGIDGGGSSPVELVVRVNSLPSGASTAFSGDCTPGAVGSYGSTSVPAQGRATCRIDLTLPEADTTPPTVAGVPDRAPNGAGWYDAPVTIDWQASDDSGSASDPADTPADTDGSGVVYTSSLSCDPSGNCAAGSLALSIDQTDPTVTCEAAPTFALGETGSVAATVGDGLSGPVSTSVSAAAVTSSPGARTVALTGTDVAGNTATAYCPYAVGYVFDGFSSPVDNGGVLNVVKAGRAIPLKWRLTDAAGAPVSDLAGATISVLGLSCSAGTSTDLVEETLAGGSGLQNLGDGYYQLNWKSPASYAGSCKTLRLDLGEGLFHTALFRFTK